MANPQIARPILVGEIVFAMIASFCAIRHDLILTYINMTRLMCQCTEAEFEVIG